MLMLLMSTIMDQDRSFMPYMIRLHYIGISVMIRLKQQIIRFKIWKFQLQTLWSGMQKGIMI